VRQGGLGKLRKKLFGDLIGNRTYDVTVCSIARNQLHCYNYHLFVAIVVSAVVIIV
jgi:hypothetical protein